MFRFFRKMARNQYTSTKTNSQTNKILTFKGKNYKVVRLKLHNNVGVSGRAVNVTILTFVLLNWR